VAQGLVDGESVDETAAKLGLSRRTVEDHRAILQRKLGVSGAAAVAATAVARGLVTPRR
jgi:DNA-binding CsgD family transcriptional regulator